MRAYSAVTLKKFGRLIIWLNAGSALVNFLCTFVMNVCFANLQWGILCPSVKSAFRSSSMSPLMFCLLFLAVSERGRGALNPPTLIKFADST